PHPVRVRAEGVGRVAHRGRGGRGGRAPDGDRGPAALGRDGRAHRPARAARPRPRLHADLARGLRLHRHRGGPARAQPPGRDRGRRPAVGLPGQVGAGPGQHRGAAGDRADHAGVDRALGDRRLRDRPPLRARGRAAAGRGAAAGGVDRRSGGGGVVTAVDTVQATPAETRGGRRMPGWARSALVVAIGIGILSITTTLTGQYQLTSSGTTQAAVRLLLPILFAALGGLWSERSGIINIGLEGMMILGTWGAAWAGFYWGPWAAVVGGLVFGALGGVLHAIATVTFGVNHIVSGVAITLLGMGVTQYLAQLVFVPLSQNPRQSPR